MGPINAKALVPNTAFIFSLASGTSGESPAFSSGLLTLDFHGVVSGGSIVSYLVGITLS